MDAPGVTMPSRDDVVFIADDDEDLLVIDEWQTESATTSDVELHAGQIQLQLRLCFVAVALLPVLAALLALAWRRYGAAIYAKEDAAEDNKET